MSERTVHLEQALHRLLTASQAYREATAEAAMNSISANDASQGDRWREAFRALEAAEISAGQTLSAGMFASRRAAG